MRADHVAAEKAGDLPRMIERDIHQEVNRQGRRVRPDLFLGRVALQHAPLALRMADNLGAVIVHNRGQVGHAGEGGLVAPRKTGHEVRLDKADEDAPVRLRIRPVHHQRAAPVLPSPHNRHALFVIGVVVDHPQPPAYLRTHDPLKLLRRVGAVRPRADDDADILLRHMRQLRQNPRQQPRRGQGAGAVGDDDRHALMRVDRLGQWRRVSWRSHRVVERGLLVRQPLDKAGPNDGGVCRGQFGCQPVAAVLEMDLHVQHPFHTAAAKGRAGGGVGSPVSSAESASRVF